VNGCAIPLFDPKNRYIVFSGAASGIVEQPPFWALVGRTGAAFLLSKNKCFHDFGREPAERVEARPVVAECQRIRTTIILTELGR
jgi:hypothetical protein